MKVLVTERLSQHKSKTPEGYLVCMDCILARTGKQDYRRGELFPDAENPEEIISVDRKPEQVFSPTTLASFENKPLTCEHPDDDVTPENYKQLSVGFVRDIKKSSVDGQDVMIGNIIVTDPQCIDDIENGVRTDLSCGYNCDITEDEHPQQINIRGNHIALCEQGRAGIAKIIDSAEGMPKKLNPADRKKLSEYLGIISTYVKGDPDIKDVILKVERNIKIDGKPISLTREEINGWITQPGQVPYKTYIFSIDGYNNHISITLYANKDWEVNEINAYITDAKPSKVIKTPETDYDIVNKNGKYCVNFDGHEECFDTEEQARSFAADQCEKAECMIRDIAIRQKMKDALEEEVVDPETGRDIKKGEKKIFSHNLQLAMKEAKDAIEDEEIPDETYAHRKALQAKRKALEHLNEKLKPNIYSK